MKVFQNALREWKREQIQVVRYRISASPTPEGLEGAKPRIDSLNELGFQCMRERIEFERPGSSPPLDPPNRLSFTRREEVGEQGFLEALALTFQNALDADFQRDYAQFGSQYVMSQYLSRCPKEDERHTWFSELAYEQNDLVGLHMSLSQRRKNPRKGHSIGCFYTIGVVPEKRGRGYVDDLLARGTQLLEQEGADCIRSTTAATNFPLVNAFERVHYIQTEHWWEFEIHLDNQS